MGDSTHTLHLMVFLMAQVGKIGKAWHGKNTQPRRNGVYYETAWRMALSSPAKLVSVTSFNEWHEGTQIEPAIPMKCGNYTYESYSPRDPRFYLDLTAKWSNNLGNRTGF